MFKAKNEFGIFNVKNDQFIFDPEQCVSYDTFLDLQKIKKCGMRSDVYKLYYFNSFSTKGTVRSKSWTVRAQIPIYY